jgi:tetratricopeptide (TPR) repeat protein
VVALKEAIAQEPDIADAYLLLGHAYLRLQQHSEAADSFALALARDHTLPGAYLGLGQAAFNLGWYETAEDNLAEALARMPSSAAAHAYLGALRYHQGRADESLNHLEQALQLDPGDTWARAYLGRTYLELGDAPAAVSELEQALQFSAGDADSHLALAKAYVATGQFEQATASFRRVLRRRPIDADSGHPAEYLLGYSEALLALKRTEEAQATLENALNATDLAELAQQAALIAGWLDYEDGRYAQARDWFAAGLAFAPQSADAQNGIGWATLQMDDCDTARDAFEKALALQPDGWTGTQTPQAGRDSCP